MQAKFFNSLYIITLVPIALVTAIKICNSFTDYNLLNFIQKNCYEDPIDKQNISEIIRSWPGFTAEEHYITTEDGYKLLVERAYNKITYKTPLIIVHGIAMSALGWVNRGNVSLAKLLGELGYDVWMLNYRGTWYSKGHVKLTTNDKNYWHFNINDLGIYDVRSTIQHVKEQTKQKPIYIGYSMGTTGFFIYSLTYPKEAKQNVKAMIGLAPVSKFINIKSILKYTSHSWPLLKQIIYTLWNGEILPGYSKLLRPLVNYSGGMYLIQSVVNLIFGDDYEQMDPLTYPQFVTQLIDSAAVNVYGHYLQFHQTGNFSKFDYGKEKNIEYYGSESPPLYDLSKIEVPVTMFVGENDWLATLQGAEYTYSQLQLTQRCGFHIVPFKKWNHVDFLSAKDLPKYLYKPLFKKIKKLDKGLCTQ